VCTKFDFAYSALPDPLAGLIRGLLLRGVEWKRKEGREGTENGGNDREGVKMPEEGEVRSGERTKKERKRRKVRTPLLSIPAYAPYTSVMYFLHCVYKFCLSRNTSYTNPCFST